MRDLYSWHFFIISLPAAGEHPEDIRVATLANVLEHSFDWEEVVFGRVQICLSMVRGADLTVTSICHNDDFLFLRFGASKFSQLYCEKIP